MQLAIENVGKQYRRDFWGLRDFSLSLSSGVLGLLGPNGAGKSTLMRILATITQATLDTLDTQSHGLIFANLVDFDMKYGHRRDPVGYARALEAFDAQIPALLQRMGPDDLLILTADHGNDPTFRGSDHTREYVPVLAWTLGGDGASVGVRDTLADAGATIAAWLGVQVDEGHSLI